MGERLVTGPFGDLMDFGRDAELFQQLSQLIFGRPLVTRRIHAEIAKIEGPSIARVNDVRFMGVPVAVHFVGLAQEYAQMQFFPFR